MLAKCSGIRNTISDGINNLHARYCLLAPTSVAISAWLVLSECYRYPRARRAAFVAPPTLVFSAYVLISSARVEMSNKFVTLYPGIRAARCRCELSTIHRLRRARINETALRGSTDVGKKLRGKRSEEVTASWRAVFYFVVASCVYTASSWRLSSALKRGRRADKLSVSFLWMFSDGGHMVPVRRHRLNLYTDADTLRLCSSSYLHPSAEPPVCRLLSCIFWQCEFSLLWMTIKRSFFHRIISGI